MKVFCVSCIFIAVCLFGTALAASGRTSDPNFSCTPGERFQEECNRCRCNGDGRSAACTLQACPRSKRQAPQPGEDGYCTPGQQFKRDCNTCTCTPNGRNAFCTQIGCSPSHSQQKRQAPHSGEEGYCTPGKQFKQDCNSCTCTPDGRYAACTEMACVSHVPQKRQAPGNPGKQPGDRGYCTPGDSYPLDCNTCYCSPHGTQYECTLMGCLGFVPHGNKNKRNAPNQPGFRCEAGKQFQYECNTCTCGPDGKTAACTYKLCPGAGRRRRQAVPLPLLRNVREAGECQNGQSKTIECNNCKCVKNRWACTKQICPRDKREAVCQPGERQQQDCNECKCVNGNWACTRKACPSKREVPTDNDFNGTPCIPNDKFNIDCNTCYCNSDGSGYSCSEKICGQSTQT